MPYEFDVSGAKLYMALCTVKSYRARLYGKSAFARAVRILDDSFTVPTLDGVSTGKKGDYLIEGFAGELYPCDRAIFEATYEEVDR